MEFEHDKGYKFFLNNPCVFAGFVKGFVKERWALELIVNLAKMNIFYL